MSDQLTLSVDDQRKSFLPDTNCVDHPPQLFETDASDQPALVAHLREGYRQDGCWKPVTVDREARHEDVIVDRDALRSWNCQRRRADPARNDGCAVFVGQRQLGEIGELQGIVLEDPSLLPLLKASIFELCTQRPENLDAVRDIGLDLLSGLLGDVPVPCYDRFLGSALQRIDGNRSVGEQRHDRGGGHQEREAGREFFHREARVSDLLSAPQRHSVSKGSLSRSSGTPNSVLMARLR